jgi:Rrf2 family protein
MVILTRKCRYALRAILELARRRDGGPLPAKHIAKQQAIPKRFLEDILQLMKESNLVRSRRGARGGYELIPSPNQISVGQIVRLVDGDMQYCDCASCGGHQFCPLLDDCPFIDVWHNARQTSSETLDSVTFQDLLAKSGRDD